MTDQRRERLEHLWRDHGPRVQAYAIRHVGRDDAGDVLADVFLTAWRRIEDVPADALPWLIVAARHTIATLRRTQARRSAMPVDTGEHVVILAGPGPLPEDIAVERDELLHALASLSEEDREVLLLVSWDGLTNAEAANVLSCTESTFRVRLHRARARLDAALDSALATRTPQGQQP